MAGPKLVATPQVSVIMPTFKQARFLRRAIDSLLTQSLTAWELIVVDDGSPDDTQAVLAPFLDDSRIRGIRFDTNQGLGCALNAGLDASSGALIAYLPSDDIWYRDHLARWPICSPASPNSSSSTPGFATITTGQLRARSTANRCSLCKPCTVVPATAGWSDRS